MTEKQKEQDQKKKDEYIEEQDQEKEQDQYKVKMDGSERHSLRNRRFLCPTTPYTR